MTTSNLEGWHYVKIVLVSLADGTTTKTINLSNRPIIEDADGSTVYYPILKAIENIGTELGDTIPNAHNGSLVIDNSPHSFGYERRFVDLLQRYTITGCTIQIYSAETTVDDIAIGADFSLDWTTTGISWDLSGDDLRIAVAEQSLSDRIAVKLIDTDSFSGAPSGSVGKYIPMIIGDNVLVKPILLNSTGTQWAFGTSMNKADGTTQFYPSITSVKAKSFDNEYQTVVSPGTTSTGLYAQASAATGTLPLSAGALAFQLKGAISSSGGILKGGKIQLHGTGAAGAVTGTIKFSICKNQAVGSGDSPNTSRVLATGVIDKADYAASFNGSSDFYVEFSFDKFAVTFAPTLLDYTYWLVIEGANEVGASVTNVNVRTGSQVIWTKTTSDQIFVKTVNSYDYVGEFYAVTFPSASYAFRASDGLGVTGLAVDQKSAAVGQTNPDLTKLDLIINAKGMTDFLGTVTASAGDVVRSPKDVISMLSLTYDGTQWSAPAQGVDTSTFSTTLSATGETSTTGTALTYARQIAGATEGRQTVSTIMADICRNAAMKIGRYNGSSNLFTLWAWGTTATSVATITDDECKVLAVRALGPETVINRVQMQWGKDPTATDIITSAAAGTLAGYSKSAVYDIGNDVVTAGLSTTSVSLYGRKELASTAFNFISTNLTAFARAVGSYFLRVFAYPSVYIDIEVPLYKYRSLDTLQVITLVSPKLPSYFGTSANALLPYYSGASVDVSLGFPYKRAEAYRAQIEGKVLNYNLGDFPTMRLSCRLLLNYPNDPT